ncbi:glutamyl-tRNA synthetase [Xylariomycetidae sp. FL0641]|nr:glutamyl-tRNA synthetase [Xylariomycetidae sp. FL0641]
MQQGAAHQQVHVHCSATPGLHDYNADQRRSNGLSSKVFQELRKPLEELDAHLTLRTHLVGHSLTIADLAVWGTIRGNPVASANIKRLHANAFRYSCGSQCSWCELRNRHPAYRRPDRGNSERLLRSFTSGGTLVFRFDDTNPSKESMEFQDAILEVLHSMGEQSRESQNDYFQAMRRDLSVKETLARFEDMNNGMDEGKRWCLRAKIAYDSPNGALRDPVIYRCNDTPHRRTGSQWRIYPTYDFCAPILDSIEGVTLALLTNEYRDRNAQYAWMQGTLCLRKAPIWDFSRINFVRTFLSKRKLTKIVEDARVCGWDGPRMPTVKGILRRGVTAAALREFILRQCPSRNILNLEWGAFWALNKKYVDPVVPRHTAVAQAAAVRCTTKHAKNADIGMKKVLISNSIVIEQADAQSLQGEEEVTLMNWGNAYARSTTLDPNHNTVVGIDFQLHLEGDVKKTRKLTWLAASEENMVPVDLATFDYLLSKDKLEKGDGPEDFLTSVTEVREWAFADCNVKDLRRGDLMRFDRKGFFKVDKPYEEGSTMVFFGIPSGKS